MVLLVTYMSCVHVGSMCYSPFPRTCAYCHYNFTELAFTCTNWCPACKNELYLVYRASLVPRPFFAGAGKNGLGTTVRACVGYSVKSR